MAQVNKYADRAAYTADAKRLSTKSAVSFIENETTTIYDGVNTVVGKSAAAIGDLAVFDKTDGVIKYIKSATIAKAQIPANLVPLAVVYARQGEQLLIVSLDHVSGSIRWAHTYEVALSGFDLAAGGTIVLKLGSDPAAAEVSIAYTQAQRSRMLHRLSTRNSKVGHPITPRRIMADGRRLRRTISS